MDEKKDHGAGLIGQTIPTGVVETEVSPTKAFGLLRGRVIDAVLSTLAHHYVPARRQCGPRERLITNAAAHEALTCVREEVSRVLALSKGHEASTGLTAAGVGHQSAYQQMARDLDAVLAELIAAGVYGGGPKDESVKRLDESVPQGLQQKSGENPPPAINSQVEE